MRGLVDLLESIPSLQSETSLSQLGCHAQTGETVIVRPCETDARGMQRAKGKKGTFYWEIDQDCAELFAELVEVLTSGGSGHQYLECGFREQITVKVSCREYPDDFLIKTMRV